jgi:DNA-binding CsgD family transcriptional regulator
MGGPGSGRQRDPAREAAMAELRRQGLTLAEIGERFGITRQAVKVALDRPPAPPRPPRRPTPPPPTCRGCGSLFPTRPGGLRVSTLCLPCLARRPDATLAERLRAHRVAAGLTCSRLAQRAGVKTCAVTHYEVGRRVPTDEVLRRLARVLGLRPIETQRR